MGNGVKSWSYTALSQYESCPRQFFYERVKKIKDKDAPKPKALQRGIDVHDEGEKFLTHQISYTPKDYLKFEHLMLDLRDMNPMVEQNWGFKLNWSPTSPTNWNECWLRIKMDAFVPFDDGDSVAVDFKTGKNRGGYDLQMELYALGVFCKFPEVKAVSTRLWFVDSGDEVIENYERAMVPKAKERFEKRVRPMFNDEHFATKPSRLCAWCDFSKDNGGPCEY